MSWKKTSGRRRQVEVPTEDSRGLEIRTPYVSAHATSAINLFILVGLKPTTFVRSVPAFQKAGTRRTKFFLSFDLTSSDFRLPTCFCQLLQKLAALNLDIPITLILDNARYQKCQIVFEIAKELGIELVYLPAYSPHLNLIERLWKFIRNECLYSKYYSDFSAFKAAISHCLDTAHTDKKDKLTSWLSWNFQCFKKVKVLAV